MTIPSGDVARMLAGRARLAELATLFSPGIEPPPPLSPAARKQMRRRMFAERPVETVSRMFKATRAALQRDGIGGCLRAAELLIREKSIGALGLPDPDRAMTSPDGLCGLANDLSAATLMDGYERGLYPSAHFGPMKWWAPKTRALSGPALLRKRLAGADIDGRIGATVAFDRDFEAAVCDEAIDPPIPPRLKWAFARLFDAGFAHSFDVLARNGERIGGGFGVAVGRVFVIEAMRFKDEAAMQSGVSALAGELDERGFIWVDAKRLTPELASCGFDATPRAGYASRLKASLGYEKVGRWSNWQLEHAA
jgi:leucyl/phenylalanyl-tRNA---protein transferase